MDAFVKDNSRELEQRLLEVRSYKVVKANELIQKSRFQLSLQEQKIILYLISKIKPEDMELKEHTFEIVDFCKVCGIDKSGGSIYKYLKQTLKELRDKSIWIELENGAETTLAWIDKVTINKNSGSIMVKIDDMMKPYLIQLQQRFTQYELLYTLAMKSQYSTRLYEILKSYEYRHRINFEIDAIKKLLSAEKYIRFPDFRRFVLDAAAREINEFSDLTISYEAEKKGRKVVAIEFLIKEKKDMKERLETWARIDEVINPAQLSLFDKINGEGKK